MFGHFKKIYNAAGPESLEDYIQKVNFWVKKRH